MSKTKFKVIEVGVLIAMMIAMVLLQGLIQMGEPMLIAVVLGIGYLHGTVITFFEMHLGFWPGKEGGK